MQITRLFAGWSRIVGVRVRVSGWIKSHLETRNGAEFRELHLELQLHPKYHVNGRTWQCGRGCGFQEEVQQCCVVTHKQEMEQCPSSVFSC